MAMVFCRMCGNSVHYKAQRCLNCGTDEPVKPPESGRPAPPRLRTSDAVVWVLAFAPVLGALAEMLLAALVHGSGPGAALALAHKHYVWVTVLLNVALCVWDERRLYRSGVKTAAFGSVLWVPVYLFKRARALGHRPPAYFIGWVVCCGLVLVF